MSNYILLVEDNPDDQELTKRALARHNIANELVIARDGVEALEFLHGEGPPGIGMPFLPQVILLDLRMPRVDGFDVLKQIRQDRRTALLPVVVLTSSAEDEDLVRSYQMGANSYVRKPVRFEEFAEAIRQLGLYWLVLNLRPSGGR